MVRRRTHQINFDLRGADRQPWHSGRVTLILRRFDMGGFTDEWFTTPQGARDRLVCDPNWFPLELHRDLAFSRGEVYDLIATAADHHQNNWQLTRRSFNRTGGRTALDLQMILIPKRPPSSPDLHNGFNQLADLGSPLVGTNGLSSAQYQNLNMHKKMALLNLEAKLRATEIDGGRLIDSVTGLQVFPGSSSSPAVEPDRIYVTMDSAVKDALKDRYLRETAQFERAETGHSARRGLVAHPHGWKQAAFPRGNLHLSFSAQPINNNSGYSVDVDIDLERGNRHFGEVVTNVATGHQTNQAIVYSLLYTQGICPSYTLDP